MKTVLISVFSVLALAALQLTPLNTAVAGDDNYKHYERKWSCQKADIVNFWENQIFDTEASGTANLCATPYGLWSTLQVTGLTAGNAYTVWWVIIDDAASCAAFPLHPGNSDVPFPEPDGFAGNCGLVDFFTPDPSGTFVNPLGVFGRMDSAVASHRKLMRFAGTLRDFEPSQGSQVWAFVFGHGPADYSDKRQLARQLLTPEDPLSGIPHVGIEGRPYGYPAAVAVFEF